MSEVAGSNPLPRSSFSPKRARLPVPRPRSCDSDIDRTKARDKVLIMLLFKRGCNTKANGSTFCHSITRMGNISLISLRQSGMGLIHPGCYLLAVAGTLLVLSGGDSGDWGDEGLTALTCNPCMCLAERQAHPSPLRLLAACLCPPVRVRGSRAAKRTMHSSAVALGRNRMAVLAGRDWPHGLLAIR